MQRTEHVKSWVEREEDYYMFQITQVYKTRIQVCITSKDFLFIWIVSEEREEILLEKEMKKMARKK